MDNTGMAVQPITNDMVEDERDRHGTQTPSATETDNEIIARLAKLSLLDYDRVREDEAEKLGGRAGTLDKLVETARKAMTSASGKSAMYEDVEPWPAPVDGTAVLDDVAARMRRFIVCDPETAVAATLWIAFTWCIDACQVAPLAIITAPEKRCGKSQLLNFMRSLVRRPETASNITPAAMYRVIEACSPTLLIDEADTFLKENEELRGVINSGHTRAMAYVIRVQGDSHEPVKFTTWGAKALAGIGTLPETMMDRAVVLPLRRKLPSEVVERLRRASDPSELVRKLARFAADNGSAIASAQPRLPSVLNDRAQDNWEPLLAIADIAGGKWPVLARDAAVKLSGEEATLSMAVELLKDIKAVFESIGTDRLHTPRLLHGLHQVDEAPWATYSRGQPMNPAQLAKMLREFGVRSESVRIGKQASKGYYRRQFEDAFERYLAPLAEPEVTESQTEESPSKSLVGAVTPHDLCDGTTFEEVTAKPSEILDCDGVKPESLVDLGSTVLVEF